MQGPKLEAMYGSAEKPDIELFLNRAGMEEIVGGRMSFSRAFMMGSRMKGEFAVLRRLDTLFGFGD